MNTIHEILETNIIIASDEELGCLVTVNGSYWQLWLEVEPGRFDCRDAKATDFGLDGLYKQNTADLIDEGKAKLEEWTAPEDEEE